MATPEQVAAAVADLKDSIALIESLKSSRGFFPCLAAAGKIIGPVIKKVEAMGAALNIRGADKKALAVDIIMVLLAPLLSSWTPWVRSLIATVLPYVIDAAVTAVNCVVGKVWPTRP